jgi:hypothetical protein
VAGCCGIDAYDFSPVQIASYLALYKGVPSDDDIKTISNQLADTKTKYGRAKKITIEEMNQIFFEGQLNLLIEEITVNLHSAKDLIAQSEALRWRPASPPDAT